MNLKKIKEGVFTVEAAFIVPAAVILTALLLGYIYYMHESVWTKAAAFEAGLFSLQKINEDETIEGRIHERLEERYGESVLNFAKNNSAVTDGGSKISISWSFSVFEDVFRDIFKAEKDISIKKTDPSGIKRLEWVAKYIAG